LDEPLCRFFEKQTALDADKVEDFHRKVEAVRWLNAKTVLLRLSGGGRTYSVGDWHCIYDVAKKEFRVPQEYAEANRKALHRVARDE
jgi:hypothetical protein